MFEKMQRFLLALRVGKDPNLFYCPNTDCERALEQKELKKKHKKGPLICEHCSVEICRKCKLKSHQGKKCAETNDTKFKLWATRGGVKNCPVCHTRTQKDDGCNHMHCQRCQEDWCWICNQVADELHYDMEFRNMFKGCPGLQFNLDNGWLLLLVLISIFLFCGVVFTAGPVLAGFFGGFYLAGGCVKVCSVDFCRLGHSRCCCGTVIVLSNFLGFFIALALAQTICLSIGCVVGALAGGLLTVPTMLLTLFFGLRILFLRCKPLK